MIPASPASVSRRRSAHGEPQLAYSDLHQPGGDRRHQGDRSLAAPVPVVFDHFGGAQARLGVGQPGFGDLVELVHSGKVYVKISGRLPGLEQAPDYPDVASLAKALIAANVERIVWGTDWPHPNSVTGPGRKVDRHLAAVADRRWGADEPAPGLGTRSGDAQDHPGRQPGAPLRILGLQSIRF